MSVEWKPAGDNIYEAFDRKTGQSVRTATRTDLVFLHGEYWISSIGDNSWSSKEELERS